MPGLSCAQDLSLIFALVTGTSGEPIPSLELERIFTGFNILRSRFSRPCLIVELRSEFTTSCHELQHSALKKLHRTGTDKCYCRYAHSTFKDAIVIVTLSTSSPCCRMPNLSVLVLQAMKSSVPLYSAIATPRLLTCIGDAPEVTATKGLSGWAPACCKICI